MINTKPSVFAQSSAEGVRRVRESNGRYAYFAESSVIDLVNNQYPCDTVRVGSKLSSNLYAIAIQKSSPYR